MDFSSSSSFSWGLAVNVILNAAGQCAETETGDASLFGAFTCAPAVASHKVVSFSVLRDAPAARVANDTSHVPGGFRRGGKTCLILDTSNSRVSETSISAVDYRP